MRSIPFWRKQGPGGSAPLVVAAVLAAVVSVAAFVGAIRSFVQPSAISATQLRGFHSFDRQSTAPVALTAQERTVCARAISRLPTTDVALPSVGPSGGPKLEAQSYASVRRPNADDIVPVHPDIPAFARYRTQFYYANPTITRVDLSGRRATVELQVLPGTSKGGIRAPPFPRGTQLFLEIVGLEGAVDQPLDVALGQGSSVSAAIDVPLNGTTRAYPEDHYFAAIGPAVIRVRMPHQVDAFFAVDFLHTSRAATVPSDLRIEQVSGLKLALGEHVCSTRFGYIFTGAGNGAFVWPMTGVPLVLVLFLLHSFARDRGDDRTTTST